MMCRNCGNIYSPETLEPRGSLGITKEHDYMGDSDMSEDDKKRHEIVCNSCGAALIADETIEYAYVVNNQFYTDDYMDSFFFRYLGKT